MFSDNDIITSYKYNNSNSFLKPPPCVPRLRFVQIKSNTKYENPDNANDKVVARTVDSSDCDSPDDKICIRNKLNKGKSWIIFFLRAWIAWRIGTIIFGIIIAWEEVCALCYEYWYLGKIRKNEDYMEM
jgi:hypothetical protein